jgi:prevent-host-death family protein
MTTISIEEAQAKLPDLIHRLHSGDEVVITENSLPVARLVATAVEPRQQPRQPGTLRGSVVHMAPDFDAPLEEFRDYMEWECCSIPMPWSGEWIRTVSWAEPLMRRLPTRPTSFSSQPSRVNGGSNLLVRHLRFGSPADPLLQFAKTRDCAANVVRLLSAFGHKTSHLLVVTGDDDLFSLGYAVEQLPETGLRFESAYLCHALPSS